MGTKRPSSTLFDTQSNQKNADRPDGRIPPGETSQRPPGPTGPSDRGRGRLREDEWRGARELERVKENPRSKRKDGEPLDQRYPSRAAAPAPRTRGGDREWRERDRQVEERLRNGRLMSHLELGIGHDMDQVAMKGGTFPRMRNGSKERAKIMTALTEEEMGRDGKLLLDRPKRTESDWGVERDMDRVRRTERHGDRERYRERERDGVRARANDEGRGGGGRTREERPYRDRPRDPDPGFPERRRKGGDRDVDAGDLRDRREREMARERERSKLSVAERERKGPSPRRRDGEVYSERETWGRARTADGKRDTKSEGDSDGAAGRRRRVDDREGERDRHSRSEGDNIDRRTRRASRDEPRHRGDERHREKPRHREADVPGQRDRGLGASERDRDLYRERDRRTERDFEAEKRRTDGAGDGRERRPGGRQREGDRREWERYRDRAGEGEDRRYTVRAAAEEEEAERKYRERRERSAADPRQREATGGTRQPVREAMPPKMLPPGQSSGEWSSDLDGEGRQAWTTDSNNEERESEGDSTAEIDHDAGRDTSEAELGRRGGESERSTDRMGPAGEQRRMWLEPQRRKCSEESSLEDESVEVHTGPPESRIGRARAKDGGKQPKEHFGRLSEGGRQVDGRGDPQREMEGVSVDAEEEEDAERDSEVMGSLSGGPRRSFREARQGNANGGRDRGDREGGSDCTHSESEGGSEPGGDPGRDKGLSREVDFITVSSGGDKEDGDEEREEDELEDCQESWEEDRSHHGPPPVFYKREEEIGRRNRQSEEYVTEEEEDDDEEEREPENTTQRGKGEPSKYCVIEQTLPRERRDELSGADQPLEKVEASVPGSRLACVDETAAQPLGDTHPVLSSTTEQQDGEEQQQQPPDATRNQPAVELSASEERSHHAAEASSRADVEYRETGVRMESAAEHPYAEIGAVSRDVRTEKLLTQWRDKQREHQELTESCRDQGPDRSAAHTRADAVVSQGNSAPIPNPHHPQRVPPEAAEPGEEEDEMSIRIRMSGAWTMEEEAKRRSQAPHLMWAKNVVREILGSSEECTIDEEQTAVTRDGDEAVALEGGTEPGTAAGAGAAQDSQSSEQESGPEADEGRTEPLDLEDLRGRAQSRGGVHAEPCADMHGDTLAHTRTDTCVIVQGPSTYVDRETGGPGAQHADGAAADLEQEEKQEEEQAVMDRGWDEGAMRADKEATREKEEEEMFLSVSHALYKPRSCPCLNYDSDAHHGGPTTPQHGPGQEGARGTGEAQGGGQVQTTVAPVERSSSSSSDGAVTGSQRGGSGHEQAEEEQIGAGGEQLVESDAEREGRGVLSSSCSFRDLGPEARMRRRGIRKTAERRKENRVEEEEEEKEEEEGGVGRDRRTRIFSTAGKKRKRKIDIGGCWVKININ